jgi:hypothetical protein
MTKQEWKMYYPYINDANQKGVTPMIIVVGDLKGIPETILNKCHLIDNREKQQ